MRLVAPAPAESGPSRAALASRGSVLVSVPFAARHRLTPGDTLALIAGGEPRRVTVGGILELSGVARASGGDILLTDIFTAQDLLGKTRRRRPRGHRARSGSERGMRSPARSSADCRPGLTLEPPNRAAATAERMVRAFRFNLNALGSLTLLVGMFLVANAVSIAVLRRRPEIATLRALGTSRSAIFAAFLCEGLVVGLAGTALGEALGFVASRAALRAVAGTVSTIYAPTARIEGIDAAGPAALAAVVGMAASLLATLAPAAEAMRVAPSPAMRAGAIEGVARRRLRTRALLAGLALLLAALASRAGPIDGFPLFGFAAVVLVVAALASAAPLLVRAGAALPARLFGGALGPAGRLGAGFFGGALAKNGIAVTALAMALGMTLAMIVTVASIRQTVRVWVESTLRSDLWIKANAGGRSGIVGDLPPDIVAFLHGVDGVDAVDPFRARERRIRAGGRLRSRPGISASWPAPAGSPSWTAAIRARPSRSGPRRAARSSSPNRSPGDSEPPTGSALTLPTPSGPRAVPRGRRVLRLLERPRHGGAWTGSSTSRSSPTRESRAWPCWRGRASTPAELRRRILAAAAGRYALTITTNRELRREVLVIFDRTFAVTRALEAIAVSVAVLGIANALMASAVERRRAFGLLRAVGASGEQIRRATFVEALLCGLTGTAAAVAAGAAFAWLLLTVINPQSFGWTVALAVPVRRWLGAAALVLVASVLAGLGPGRVAASVDPAAALAGGVRAVSRHPRLSLASPRWRSRLPRRARSSSREITGPIPTSALEWWYWTGHLQGSAGATYGFQLTFFRLRDIHLAHFAWSDVASGRFTFEEKTHLALPGIAGRLGAAPRRLQRGLVRVREARTGRPEASGAYARRASDADALAREAARPARRGGALAQGARARRVLELRLDHAPERLGHAREKRENRSAHRSRLVRPRVGARAGFPPESRDGTGSRCILEDGSELMLYRMRQTDGTASPFSAGTFVPPAGPPRSIAWKDVRLSPKTTWTSPRSKAIYPAVWELGGRLARSRGHDHAAARGPGARHVGLDQRDVLGRRLQGIGPATRRSDRRPRLRRDDRLRRPGRARPPRPLIADRRIGSSSGAGDGCDGYCPVASGGGTAEPAFDSTSIVIVNFLAFAKFRETNGNRICTGARFPAATQPARVAPEPAATMLPASSRTTTATPTTTGEGPSLSTRTTASFLDTRDGASPSFSRATWKTTCWILTSSTTSWMFWIPSTGL